MRLLVCLSLLLLVGVGVVADIRGVKKSDEEKYTGATITCADPVHGSRTIPIALLNDDYCDCPYDGADEPATGACQAGKFYCANKGWRGKYVYASVVNDGVCDCCDGSDEWKTGVCTNRCEELGKASTGHLEEKLNKVLTGIKIRNDLINDAKNSRKEREERKVQLEATFAERQAIVDSLKQKVEEEEKLEKEENEKREKAAAEAAAAAAAAQPSPDAATTDATAPVGDNAAQPSESNPSTPPCPSSDNLAVSGGDDEEEEGGSRFTRKRKNSKKIKKEPPAAEVAKEADSAVTGEEKVEAEVAAFPYPAEYAYQPNAASNQEEAERAMEAKEEEEDDEAEADEAAKEAAAASAENNYVSEESPPSSYASSLHLNDDQIEALAEDDEDDDDLSFLSSLWRFIRRSPLRLYRYVTKSIFGGGVSTNQTADPSETHRSQPAKQARAALEAAEKKLDRTRVKLEEAKNLLETDFGADDQFFSLYKACFSLSHKQYTYEMCPYEDAKQKEHGSTSLGSWSGHKIIDINGKKTVVLSFSGGQGCWQGPQRSLDVHVHCGDFNKILSVEEPSKCVYLMQFESPTVCDTQVMNALQTEIENAKKGLDE